MTMYYTRLLSVVAVEGPRPVFVSESEVESGGFSLGREIGLRSPKCAYHLESSLQNLVLQLREVKNEEKDEDVLSVCWVG